jgi:hypothetical protein
VEDVGVVIYLGQELIREDFGVDGAPNIARMSNVVDEGVGISSRDSCSEGFRRAEVREGCGDSSCRWFEMGV